jgi:Uma2 family endonuclease
VGKRKDLTPDCDPGLLGGVPEHWILDLNGETLEVCREPQNGGYAQRWVLAADAQASPLEVTTQHILVGDLLT